MSIISSLFMVLALALSPPSESQKEHTVLLYGAPKAASYSLHEGVVDNPNASAGACFSLDDSPRPYCFEARENTESYFDSPQIKIVSFPINSPTQIAVFSATQDFGGSGTALLLAGLIFDADTSSIKNIFPHIVLSNQGDHQVWFDKSVSQFPLVSTADITAGPDKTIEGDHRYHIQTFIFDSKAKRYRLIDSYITKKAYDFYGTPEPISVLAKEKATITFRVQMAAHRIKH